MTSFAQMQADKSALERGEPLTPDVEDYDAVVREHPSPRNKAERAECYRLARAHKLIRLYERGMLPHELMREVDGIARRARSQ